MLCNVQSSLEEQNQHAKTFASCAELPTNIIIIYVSKAKVESFKRNLNVLWADVLALPSTHNIHCIRSVAPYNFYKVLYSTVSANSVTEFDFRPGMETAEPPTVQQVHETEPESSNMMAIPVVQEKDRMHVKPGKWYAVHWQPNDYWFVEFAIKATDQDTPLFEFIHQTEQNMNQFKAVKDIAEVANENVFYQLLDVPRPKSVFRTKYMKLSDEDFKQLNKSANTFSHSEYNKNLGIHIHSRRINLICQLF